jgi:hypothetical protein
MQDSKLEVTDGAVAGAWIEPRLGGEFGAVTLQAPRGYEAYARVFHPATDSEGKSVRWADVAKACGKVAHCEMQWHALVTPPDPVGDPSLGEMDPDELDALSEILAAYTSDPDDCFFGLCDIWAWVDELFPPERRRQPLFELPMERHHVVLHGPLTAANEIGDGALRCSPSLIWPADYSWLVASEVDFDSTLVGGSAALVEAIVESPTSRPGGCSRPTRLPLTRTRSTRWPDR